MSRLCSAALLLGLLSASASGQFNNYEEAKKYLQSDRPTDRAFALATMGLIGAEAAPSSRDVVKYMFDADPSVRQAAKLAIPTVNPELAGPVLTLVSNNEYDVRRRGLDELARMGSKGDAAVPALLEFMREATPSDRVKTVEVLADVGTRDPSLTALFANWAVNNPDPKVRAAVVKALPGMQGSAETLPAFVRALQEGQTWTERLNAVAAIAAVGGDSAAAEQALRAAVQAQNAPEVRAAAEQALEKIRQQRERKKQGG